MIIRKGVVPRELRTEQQAPEFGAREALRISDAGGLTQFGASVQTLQPGAKSSERHWHANEDELLYVVSGEATVIEDDGPHVLVPGDAACWPAGTANAHHVVNRSGTPCTYMVIGTRRTHDICHYPDAKKTLYAQGNSWHMLAACRTLRAGRVGAKRGWMLGAARRQWRAHCQALQRRRRPVWLQPFGPGVNSAHRVVAPPRLGSAQASPARLALHPNAPPSRPRPKSDRLLGHDGRLIDSGTL